MLTIYEKTKQEIESERNYRQPEINLLYPVCPYYLVDTNGRKVELKNLTDDQIVVAFNQVLSEPKNLENIKAGLKFAQALKEIGYQPSLQVVKAVLKMEDSELKRDAFEPLAQNHLSRVIPVARFLQESRGNFAKPTKEQKIQVIDQMIKNEENRKLQLNQDRTM
ncbi:MAG: hypothetical protein MJ060_00870 [Clostridia bacterium]|nr:hypothetical protein [Clostridia bacterium]